MILRYKGYWIKTDKTKWKSSSSTEKREIVREYFSEEAKYIKTRIKNFFVGWVDIYEENVSIVEPGDDVHVYHKEVYKVLISCGRYGFGQSFAGIDKDMVEQLVNKWEHANQKHFLLHIDLGCGAYQQYTLSRWQKNELIKKLKPLLEKKWYEKE